ncbi:MAG: TrmH family RNA methyltransferase [Caulobacterales bacterium]
MRSSPPLKRSRAPTRTASLSRPHRDERHDENGPSWVWGTHAALAALANPKRRIDKVIASRNAALRLPEGIEAHVLDPESMDGMLPPGAVHQGLAVRAWPLEAVSLLEACAPLDGRTVVVLDGVTDPQNVGAVFRSAAAFGARAVVMQDRKSPPFTGALAKAAAGAIELIAHAREANLTRVVEQLGEIGYRTVALEGEAKDALGYAVTGDEPIALVIGAEGKGLREVVAAACSRRARIPIADNVESLNVSVAAAIALYEAQRARR